MEQPYLQLFQPVFSMAVTEAVARGATSRIEVFLDNQDLFRQTILNFYPDMIELESDDAARSAVMPYHPMFRDDKEWVILQAADMLAGELRLTMEDYPDNPSFIGNLCPSLPVSRFFTVITEEKMEQLHDHLIASMEREEAELNALHKRSVCGD